MIDLKIALRTTLLLVDDDPDQLELRSLVLKMSGFTVLTASGPVEAIRIMQRAGNTVDIAVFDYQMPVMNGCVLAGYLRTQYPELKIILYSAAVRIPDSELSSVDVSVSKTEGMALLLEQVSAFAEVRATDHAGQIWF